MTIGTPSPFKSPPPCPSRLATSSGFTRSFSVCAGRSTRPAPAIRTSGPARRRSEVSAWPLATLELAPSVAKSVFSAAFSCQPERIPVLTFLSVLAMLMPRMAPSVKSNFAEPLSPETMARWLAPLVARSSVMAPVPSMRSNPAASLRKGYALKFTSDKRIRCAATLPLASTLRFSVPAPS